MKPHEKHCIKSWMNLLEEVQLFAQKQKEQGKKGRIVLRHQVFHTVNGSYRIALEPLEDN